MNDDELTEMMHNAYIMNNTESHDGFNFEEFYAILTKKKWLYQIIICILFKINLFKNNIWIYRKNIKNN
jgi:hypothetical protein